MVLDRFVEVSEAVADFYIEHCTPDGIVFWDTGAPGLTQLDDYLNRRSDPYNDVEPVDSSSAAISAQGLLRLGRYLHKCGEEERGQRYFQSGLTMAETLLEEPYLSTDPNHQGLLLHSVYHRPNGWDHVPEGRKVPCGESCMWGDYHLLELGVYIKRLAESAIYHKYYLDQ